MIKDSTSIEELKVAIDEYTIAKDNLVKLIVSMKRHNRPIIYKNKCYIFDSDRELIFITDNNAEILD